MTLFVDLPWPILLDSGHSQGNNYPKHHIDIIAAAPTKHLISRNNTTYLKGQSGEYNEINEPFFSAIRLGLPKTTRHPNVDLYPIAPGWMGCLSYDLSKQLEHLPSTTSNDTNIPDAAFGFYEWVIATNHKTKSTCFIYIKGANVDAVRKRLQPTYSPTNNDKSTLDNFQLKSNFQSDQSKVSYQENFKQIKNYILSGDTYQINFAQRFSAKYSGSSWGAYQTLRADNPAPMGAFFATEDFQLLSLSPERFIKAEGNQLTTSPIKGTRPRAQDAEKDQQNKEDLGNSPKDQAENLMIVDLLRNDFGKVCKAGSIAVPSLFEIESFPNVHHLVSTITGTLNDSYDGIDAIKQGFPGGSITGTPKVRAMEIIDELENHHRSAYCGSMAYFNTIGACDSNINIRTFVLQGENIHCWGGGGIVADSICEDEYQETFDKVERFLLALEKKR
ncbi:aminodeoxychorismate synthase, component I [Gammaproteobacteria bacterium 42_54_T18]|nr:aminodeoxychorismate synthase, component I [Gammaproteobacteria bacterium 42_54_T18]